MEKWTDTICALSTPPGVGAIGVIRLSGSEAFAIGNILFSGKDLSKARSHSLHFGYLHDKKGTRLDEVLISVMRGPNTYTGEDTLEISGHGSPYILNQIIDACVAAGARLAGPGEFTQRAFLNGKMDLAQAEAVADLIASESKAAHEIALNQLKGGISTRLTELRQQLIHFTSMIELELDFAEEDVQFADKDELNRLLQELSDQIQKLIQSFSYGHAIKNGVPVTIIGKPNAGKSTLLNALLEEDRAIVSNIAGTTRDVIEEQINLEGIAFRFIDTAGIRDTEDEIEAIGVARAKEKVKQARIVLYLYDSEDDLLEELAPLLSEKSVFCLHSKADKYSDTDLAQRQASLQKQFPRFTYYPLSVKSALNLSRLKADLVSTIQTSRGHQEVVISNIRHKAALEHALEAVEAVQSGLEQGISHDFLAIDLKQALFYLGSITGKIEVDRDILGTIFGKFCIGK